MNMFSESQSDQTKLSTLLKGIYGRYQIHELTHELKLIFQLHLLKAKFLANYSLKFNRLVIVGKWDSKAFKRTVYNLSIGYVCALLYLHSNLGFSFFIHSV